MKDILTLLKEHREKKGYSLEYISDMLGVSSSTVSRWEHCQSPINITKLEQYIEILEIDKKVLFASLAKLDYDNNAIAEVTIEVFSPRALNIIMNCINDLGIEQATISTKRAKIWK